MMNQDLMMTDKVIVQDGEVSSNNVQRTSNMTFLDTNKKTIDNIDTRLVVS